MSNQIDFLMEEYKRLGVSEAEAASAIKNLLGTTMARNEQARSERFSPGVTGFLGAASGFLRPGTNAADGYSKAMDAYQSRQETDPFVDQKMIGGYLDTERKEINDLRAKVLDQMRIAKNGGSEKGFSGHTTDGGSYILNNSTGDHTWVKAPVGATRFATSVGKMMTEKAIADGTYTPENKVKINQEISDAYDQYVKATPEIRNTIEKKYGIANENDPVVSVKPGSVVSLGDPNIPNSGNFTPEQLAAIKADAAKDKTLLPHGSIVQPAHTVSGGSPTFKTPQQLANEKAMGESENKSYHEYKDKLDSMWSANQQIAAMEGMLEADKMNSGAAHEALNKIGGYMSYLDPKNELAQNAGNDAAYYSKMMELVRDKIKALGAGTAVSNLDLIVTQKSVGDLRNTTQGNLKIMALMKLANATIGNVMNEKIGYYDSKGNTFQGYKRDTTPTHAIKYKLLPNGNWAFDIEDKDTWIERAKVANGGTLPKDINSRWKNYADSSVKNLSDPDKLLKGR